MSIKVESGSFNHGNYLKIIVDGEQIKIDGERGIGLVVVEKGTRKIIFSHMFDTYLDPNESSKLNSLLYQIKPGNWIIMGIKDDGSRSMTLDLIHTISDLGSNEINKLGYRDSWGFIGIKGKPDRTREIKDSLNSIELIVSKKPLHHIIINSGAYHHGNIFSMMINENPKNMIIYSKESQRGIVMIILDKAGNVRMNQIYDTYFHSSASDELEASIKTSKSQYPGNLIILGVKDEGSRSLSPSLRKLISSLGSKEIHQLGNNESWCFISRIGNPLSTIETREINSLASLTWLPKSTRNSNNNNNNNNNAPRYTIHYNPPSLIVEKSDANNNNNNNVISNIVDIPVQSVHHRHSLPSGPSVAIGMSVRNNRARKTNS